MTSLHLCLVSEQLPANLIPALKQRPASVWLASSTRMLAKAKTLKRLLEKNGTDCKIVLSDLADSDFQRMQQQADELSFQLLDQGLPIVLNATGGNKLMTLAFWNTLGRELKDALEVQYCDTQHNQLVTLFPQYRSEQLGQCLDLQTYLAAYDYRISAARSRQAEWLDRAARRKRLSKWLGQNIHVDPIFLGMLNGAAHDAMLCFERGDVYGSKQPFRSDVWGFRLDALREISKPDYQLVEWKQDADSLQFLGIDAARYLCGGWLEEHVWHCAKDCGAHDAHCSVTVQKGDARNELDCAIVHNNRLLVIECKAAAIESGGADTQNILHKLDNISSHAGGLFAERMLLSARSLGEANSLVRQRAQSYRIQLVDGTALAKLRDALSLWLGPR